VIIQVTRTRALYSIGELLREAYLRTYIGVLLAFALALAASWIYWHNLALEWPLVVGTLVLASFVLLGDLFPLRVSDKSVIGVWDVGLIVAVVALGPTWAAIAALPSAFVVGRRNWLRTVYEIGHSITIVYLAGIAFSFTSTPLLLGATAPTGQVLYGTFTAGLVLLIANRLVAAVLLKIKYNQAFYRTWKEEAEPYLRSDAVNVLTAGLGALALTIGGPHGLYGPAVALLVVGGSIGSQLLVFRSREQVKEIGELQARVGSLEEALATSNATFGTMIVQELGRRDGYTHRHAAATAVYASDLAREMKLADAHVGRLRMAGLLHNIGLFGLPEELLLATGKLNSIAQSQLAEHPARGEEALAAIPEFEEMASWVRWHHERPDGRGYPDKLRGAWIPLEAKILTVAQAYAAMVLDQPRRPGIGFAEAREHLSAGIDTEFDGVVVRAFLRILDTESEGYRMADDHRFVFPAPEQREHARLDEPEQASEGSFGLGRKELI
jgi:HD-GYP domain-containing protein (c-di-GMP phosphodiesterase class II)